MFIRTTAPIKLGQRGRFKSFENKTSHISFESSWGSNTFNFIGGIDFLPVLYDIMDIVL